VKRNYLLIGAALLAAVGMAAAAAQDPPQDPPKDSTKDSAKKSTKKTAQSKNGSSSSAEKGGSAEKGKGLFDEKCGICHFAESDAKKIGPGLKGLSKRGTFTVNSNKVTDENLKAWIENGDTLMPPFKGMIDDQQIKDIIAYVKSL
jgi:cytochrome c